MTFFRFMAAAALTLAASNPAAAQPATAPRILIDLPERQVEYQLGRLTIEQLVEVERRDDDPKYRPVYRAILSRRGVPAALRDEAVAALVKLDKSTPARVLLDRAREDCRRGRDHGGARPRNAVRASDERAETGSTGLHAGGLGG